MATRFDLTVGVVYHPLACYHDHPRELRDVEADRQDTIAASRASIDRPNGIDPDTA